MVLATARISTREPAPAKTTRQPEMGSRRIGARARRAGLARRGREKAAGLTCMKQPGVEHGRACENTKTRRAAYARQLDMSRRTTRPSRHRWTFARKYNCIPNVDLYTHSCTCTYHMLQDSTFRGFTSMLPSLSGDEKMCGEKCRPDENGLTRSRDGRGLLPSLSPCAASRAAASEFQSALGPPAVTGKMSRTATQHSGRPALRSAPACRGYASRSSSS